MSVNKPLDVVLFWHMHQPEYRDSRSGQYHLPWTYLHAIKDYVDMAAHLEAHPAAKAVVNFSPTLLEQMDDYARQVDNCLKKDVSISDNLLDMLVQPVLPNEGEQRIILIKHCLRANDRHLIKRFPHYNRLAGMAKWLEQHPGDIIYIHEQYLVDILVWFHLAWMGETVRRSDVRVKRLVKKASAFTLHDRRELLGIIGELLSGIIERYRRLAESGQIEISMTPYAHPIMPLLSDIQSATEAVPDIRLPVMQDYPDGSNRTRWHIKKGVEVFRHYFGFQPLGCWPSEGGLSTSTVSMLHDFGFKWTASGGTVLRNSLEKSAEGNAIAEKCIHVPFHVGDIDTACFFRDDGLSDLIGFEYSDWHADDAVADFANHLGNIAEACADTPGSIVSVILDGENAWEYYPSNGYYFLNKLYKTLVEHPGIRLTTFSDYLTRSSTSVGIQELVSGSWVHGTFSTWIGNPDKNLAWDMLGGAKQAYDEVIASDVLDDSAREAATKQLAICEASDWFWWFGDYNPAESVSDFDYMYRLHLSNLYTMLGVEPPAYLAEPISHGSGTPERGGMMRRGSD